MQPGVGVRPKPRSAPADGRRSGLGAGAKSLSDAALYAHVQDLRRKESILQAELVALRTRRRQREAGTLARAASSNSPTVERLRKTLVEVQRKRELIAAKNKELQQTKLRVRPRDLRTLQRAREVLEPKLGERDDENREAEDQLALERAKIEKLQRQQREALRRSQDQRMELYRELIEERILKDELAAEPEQY